LVSIVEGENENLIRKIEREMMGCGKGKGGNIERSKVRASRRSEERSLDKLYEWEIEI
jgi:hypothetical protein